MSYRLVPSNKSIIIGFSIITLCLCLALFYATDEIKYLSPDISSLFEWKYINIMPVSCLYLMAFLIVSIRNRIVSHHVTIPSILFLISFGFYLYLGSFDHYLRVLSSSTFIYEEAIPTCYNFISLALLGWLVGYSLSQNLRFNENSSGCANSILIWDRRRLYGMNIFWGSIGLTSFIVFFAFYVKGLPLLQGHSPNVSKELIELVSGSGSGHTISLIAVNATTMALLFSGVYLINFRASFNIIIIFLASLTCFLLWGARVYIAFPLLVIIVLACVKKSWGLQKIFLIFLILALLAATYGVVRNRNFFNRFNLSLLEQVHISPEFRDTLGVITHLDELRTAYNKYDFFESIYLTALPSKIWNAIGINKDKIFSEETGIGWLIASTTRGSTWTAIRPGLLGQTLIAFGIFGVIFIFFLIGFVLAQLDRLARNQNSISVVIVYTYLIAILFSYLIIGMLDSVFLRFWYFTYGFILTAFFSSKRETIVIKK